MGAPSLRSPLAWFFVSFFAVAAACSAQQPSPRPIQVYFSPRGGCTTVIINELAKAKSEVLIQAFGFTSKEISMATAQAHKRGVPVRVILDKSNQTDKYSAADFLVNMGVPVWIDDKHAIAHNKIMIIDGRVVITGSFNFTNAAEERNAENLLVITDERLAQEYQRNWKEHLPHSPEYIRKQPMMSVAGTNSSTSPLRFLGISESPDTRKKFVRFSGSNEVLMQQIALSGEKMIWVGDPEADASNDRKVVFAEPDPPVFSRGRRGGVQLKGAEVPPPERHMLVVLTEDGGPPYAEWVRQQRFGYVIHAKSVKCIWYGYPTKEREKYMAERKAARVTSTTEEQR